MIKVIPVGALQENTVIMVDDDTKEAVIIDPGAEGDKILKEIEGFNPVAIVNTHGHRDHVGQVGYLKEKLNIPFYMNKKDEFLINNDIFLGFGDMIGAYECLTPDFDLKEGDVIKFGNTELKVIETPGHTPGGVCLYDEKNKILIAGDTLFSGSVGRTDLPGGDSKELMKSLKKLIELPEETVVICGHGENTTIGKEKKSNPYITGIHKISF